MKILVIQKKMMGDILVCSIVFEALRKKNPNAELHYLIEKKYSQIVENHQFIDKIIYFGSLFETIKAVRKERYDVIIDGYSKVETALIGFLSGIPRRVSFYKKYTAPFYTDTIERDSRTNQSTLNSALEHRLWLLEPFGIKENELILPQIFVSEKESLEAEQLLTDLNIQNEKLIMISTFGSNTQKTYPMAYMAEVLNFIAQQTTAKLLCNYLPFQKEEFQKLYAMLSDIAKERVVKDFDTKNLRQYIAVLEKCEALLGNEGGSTNISKAMKIPTFSIYAPNVSGWDWALDGVKNVSIHAENYQIDNYIDFVPNIFMKDLEKFLKHNISS